MHLREGLHDRMKRQMDPQVFKKLNLTTFAARGGMWGTTAALNAWCCNLAIGINKRDVVPQLVAFVLNFVEVPQVAPEVPLNRSAKAGGRTVQFAPPGRHVSVGSVDSEQLAFDEFLEGQCRQQGDDMGTVDIDFADELDVDLESELESMKISSLQRRAASAGATPAELRVAQDQDDPKTALIDLIHAKQGGTSETSSESSDNLPSEAPGMVDSVAPMAPRSVSRVNISDSDDDDPKESNSGGDVVRRVSGLSGRSSELDTDVPTWQLLQEEEAELQRREQERRANEAERERLEVEKLEEDQTEADPLAVEKAAKEETDRIAAEEEQERLAAEAEAKAEAEATAKAEADKEKEEADRLATEQEQERLAAAAKAEEEQTDEKAEADRVAAESAAEEEEDANRLKAEQEQERLVKEAAAKAEADILASQLAAKQEAIRLERDRLAAEKAEADRLVAENAAREEAHRGAVEQEQERLAAEAAEANRLASELEAKEEADLLEQEQFIAEKVEADRLAAEKESKLELERITAEKAEADKITEQEEAVRAGAEQQERLVAEDAAEVEAAELAPKEEAEKLEQESLEDQSFSTGMAEADRLAAFSNAAKEKADTIEAEHAAEVAAKAEADPVAAELEAKEQVNELVTENAANVGAHISGPELAINEGSDRIEPGGSAVDKQESEHVVEDMLKEEDEVDL